MKKLEDARVNQYPYLSEIGDLHGVFEIHGPGRYKLHILSSGERHGETGVESWEHVSISVKGKRFCPSWEEMCFVKDLFWDEEEAVLQFHPPRSEYVNMHNFVLHLWKPPFEVNTPPSIAVGFKQYEGLDALFSGG